LNQTKPNQTKPNQTEMSSKADIEAAMASGGGNKGGKTVEWDKFVPKAVGKEDALSPPVVQAVWDKLYAAVGKSSAGEDAKLAIRCGVYAYGLLNGTSRAGNYSRTIITSDGFEFSAAEIPRATGTTRIRQFFRGNMKESYDFFKSSGYVQKYEPRFVSKAATLGIGPDEAFAMGDWFAGCPWFTPLESRAHEASGNRGLNRARSARGGDSLEDVEADAVEAAVNAGGAKPAMAGKAQW